MADYHLGPLFRFIPIAFTVMTRVVSGALQVFARNTPVEFEPDDPGKLPGYNKWWYVGDTIVHSDPFNGTISYSGMTFSLPYPDVLVAHVANSILYFAVDSGSSTITLYVIDLTNATPSDTVQDPTDKIQPVIKIDPVAAVLTTYAYYISGGELVGELGEWTEAITIPAGFGGTLVPALNADCSQFIHGYSSDDWLARVFTITMVNAPPTPTQLANMRANPNYPYNLTIGVYMDSFTPSDWDGVKTAYGPGNTPFPATNGFGALGVAPAEQSYAVRQNSHAYTAGQKIHIGVVNHEGPYWIADNNGTSANLGANPASTFFDAEDPQRPDVPIPKSSVTDGSVTWTLGGRYDGSPTGEFTYTDPISAEFTNAALDSTYGQTLEDAVAAYANESHTATGNPAFPFRDLVYETVNAPTAFSNISYATIPVGWGTAPFGADDILINPLVRRVAKLKVTETLYDDDDIPQTPTETWFYVSSHRSLMIYRYPVREFLPSYSSLAANGTVGVTGKQLIGWCLNRTSQLVEEMYYQEISGATTTGSSSGTRPCNAVYSFWPQPLVTGAGTSWLTDLEANQPGVVSGGDFEYTSGGDDRIITGFYIGTQLQYQFYDGYQSFDVHGGLVGSAYSGPFYNRVNTGGTVTEVEQFSGKKQNLITLAGPPYRQLANYQAQAYGLIGWEESSWFAEGGSALRSIDQTFSCAVAGSIGYSQTNTLVDSTTADYNDSNGALRDISISPLNASGACLFAVYWQYLDSWSGGGTANPYVNQKLFTSAGQGLTEVDFNGTVVALADLNTSYPGLSADPVILETISS